MSSVSATHEDLEQILGDVDDLVIERIIDTNATLDEVVEALGALEDELRFGEHNRIPSSHRVTAVRTVLEELIAGEPDQDEDYGIMGPQNVL